MSNLRDPHTVECYLATKGMKYRYRCMNLGKLREVVRGREAWSAAVPGLPKSQTQICCSVGEPIQQPIHVKTCADLEKIVSGERGQTQRPHVV